MRISLLLEIRADEFNTYLQVGELEMFSERPRSCRLVANDDSVVWKLSKMTFEEMADENPRLMLKFVTKVAVSFDAVRFYNTVYHWAQLR